MALEAMYPRIDSSLREPIRQSAIISAPHLSLIFPWWPIFQSQAFLLRLRLLGIRRQRFQLYLSGMLFATLRTYFGHLDHLQSMDTERPGPLEVDRAFDQLLKRLIDGQVGYDAYPFLPDRGCSVRILQIEYC